MKDMGKYLDTKSAYKHEYMFTLSLHKYVASGWDSTPVPLNSYILLALSHWAYTGGSLYTSLVPRLFGGGGKKSLVSTVCACA